MSRLLAISILLFCAIGLIAQTKPNIDWAEIPAGTFTMFGEPTSDNKPTPHQVTLSPFKLSKCEITIKQFKTFIDATGYVTTGDKQGYRPQYGTDYDNYSNDPGSYIMKSNDFKFKKNVNWKCDTYGNVRPESEYNHPVIHVSWYDAKAFADWMNCRLPTEAEWEYSCRAETTSFFNTGHDINTSQANYNDDTYKSIRTRPVGSFLPNKWGLYDMHGNVKEWCNDFFANYPAASELSNPKGPTIGQTIGSFKSTSSGGYSSSVLSTMTIHEESARVMRGGGWYSSKESCYSLKRESYHPEFRRSDIGFRIVSDK
jgi:formylglycine-generating enzyme required for sulfatase activity